MRLFGSLQKITAQKLGLSPVLICTANSTGGVMGKMINTQSIVVAAAATNQTGREGRILRFVFWHSVALACLMGLLVLAQAYVLKWMVPGGRRKEAWAETRPQLVLVSARTYSSQYWLRPRFDTDHLAEYLPLSRVLNALPGTAPGGSTLAEQ